MRRVLMLFGALLFCSISSAAQVPAAAAAGSFPSPWQLAVGYQFNRLDLAGARFNTHGINLSLVRFLNSWLGVEAQASAGFGNTGSSTVPASLDARSIFAGVGPRVAYRGHGRLEPWAHAELGLPHVQTAMVFGSHTSWGWELGAGVDFSLRPHVSIRAEEDLLNSYFFSSYQRHIQAVGAFVYNF